MPVALRLDGLGSLLVEHVAVAVVEALQGKLAAERGDREPGAPAGQSIDCFLQWWGWGVRDEGSRVAATCG
ncbi:hypothetical protein GCM10010336_61520 [Streptomyces goshikiensis]|nr:hypothetical protein GCM10010336_61520 [Streptomyces goshikiensis]